MSAPIALALGLVSVCVWADTVLLSRTQFVVSTGLRDAGPTDLDASIGPYWAGVSTDVTWQAADLVVDGGVVWVDFNAPSVVTAGCGAPGRIPLVQVVPYNVGGQSWGWLGAPGEPVAAWLSSTATPSGQPPEMSCTAAVGLVTHMPFELTESGQWNVTPRFLVDDVLLGLTIDPTFDGGAVNMRANTCTNPIASATECRFDAGSWALEAGRHSLVLFMVNLQSSGYQNPAGVAASITFDAVELFDAGSPVDGGLREPLDAGNGHVGSANYLVGCDCSQTGSHWAVLAMATLLLLTHKSRRRRTGGRASDEVSLA